MVDGCGKLRTALVSAPLYECGSCEAGALECIDQRRFARARSAGDDEEADRELSTRCPNFLINRGMLGRRLPRTRTLARHPEKDRSIFE